MYNVFQRDRGWVFLSHLSKILLVAALLTAGTSTWAQSRPIALPISPVFGNDPIPALPTGLFRRVDVLPRIRHSVPAATLDIWRQLACRLPSEHSEATDLSKLLTELSRYAGVPIDVQLSSERLEEIGSMELRPSRDETWFSELRAELAQHDIEVIVQPPGLVVRVAKDQRDSDGDTSEFSDAIQVIYEISELPIGSEYLLEMINELVHRDSWAENGGDGICEVVTTRDGRYLVVQHHEDRQAAVLMLLETLALMSVEPSSLNRQARLRAGVRNGLIRCAMHPTTQAMVSLLESPTPEHLRRPLPLRELAEYLKYRGIRVRPNIVKALDLPNSLSPVIDLRQNRGTFYNDLKGALSNCGLAFALTADRIEIEIDENRDAETELAVYDATSLQVSDQALRTVLQVAVSPQDWAENGGDGEFIVAKVGNRQLIAVCQSPQLQWQVRRFLGRLAEFVVQVRPVEHRWPSLSASIGLPTTHFGSGGSSRAILLPQPTHPGFTEPSEFTVDSWPIHELQADFWTKADCEEDFHQYPIFYDITELDVEDEVVYELLDELVGPEWWEANGGIATSLIERFGPRKVLITRTTSPHQYAIARFLERLTRAVGRRPPRSNWRMLWAPEPILAAVQTASLPSPEVEVFELPSSALNFDVLRQVIMETMEPDTWLENGGDYELVFATINQRQLLVVHHRHDIIQRIRRFLRERL